MALYVESGFLPCGRSSCQAQVKRQVPSVAGAHGRARLHRIVARSFQQGSSSGSGRNAGNGGGGGKGGGGGSGGGSGDSEEEDEQGWRLGTGAALVFCSGLVLAERAYALCEEEEAESCSSFWEVTGGKWMRYVDDKRRGGVVLDTIKTSEQEALEFDREAEVDSEIRGRKLGFKEAGSWFVEAFKSTMLPVGYPKSVTEDYTEYSLWRMGQIIASQISGVLTTQALLYAVGLGKGAIPTAAATNWVLKDGIGYLSKIVLSKYGRHFDVNPKGWRLLSDLMEDVANGLELLTPSFPHLFVPLTAIAGAGKSASGLIQAATRSCFYAGFAAQHNFAEVIAKGEAQGMLGKWVGIAMGIGISGKVGASGPLLLLTFTAVTSLHVVCNLKSYQAVQLNTLNPYRTGLLVGEYLHSERILSIREVNSVEPIFSVISKPGTEKDTELASREARVAAADIAKNLQLGVPLGEVISNQREASSLLELYRNEQYILVHRAPSYKVVLKGSALPHDMLRAVVQACYMNHILRYTGCKEESQELLRVSYDTMSRNFERIMVQLRDAGWVTEGVVARPAPNRIVKVV